MARALGVPCTELSYEDIALGSVARRSHVNPEAALINLHDLQSIVRVSAKEARAVLDIFLREVAPPRASGGGGGASAVPEASGRITFEQLLDLFMGFSADDNAQIKFSGMDVFDHPDERRIRRKVLRVVIQRVLQGPIDSGRNLVFYRPQKARTFDSIEEPRHDPSPLSPGRRYRHRHHGQSAG
jgi:hypothetical protein